MTSLFRRSSSNGSSRSGSSAQELNNSRPARQVRRLEFNQAMEDFKTIWLKSPCEVLKCEQLRGPESCFSSVWNGKNQLPGVGSTRLGSKPAGAGRPGLLALMTLSQFGVSPSPKCCLCLPHRTDVPAPGSTPAPGRYRNWNPPLLGNLPEDFLRILPQQTTSTQVRLTTDQPLPCLPPAQGSHSCQQPVPRGLAPRGQGSLEQERRWKQYLEDERIALFLQNEEFMKELQRNRDFLLALERDRLKYESKKSKSTSVAVSNDFGFSSILSGDVAPSVTSEAGGAVSDDALFRDKLKHMGK
ncbi:CUED1 protein, partial [Ceuthmochares aereus]|nr:CUED1 protein [Ceuthmochares aereus]